MAGASAHYDSLAGRVCLLRCDNTCVCGAYGVQAAHIIPRSRLGRRSPLSYDQRNIIGLCPTCHAMTEKRDELLASLVQQVKGEGVYEQLRLEARVVTKYADSEISEMMARYRAELKGECSG